MSTSASATPSPDVTRVSAGRAARAVAVTLVVAVGASLFFWRACAKPPEERFVQSSSPAQVSVPGHAPRPKPAHEVQVGEKAPALALADLAGVMTALDSWRGKVIVLNAWASWCPPCREEMPSLQKLASAPPEGVVIVGVAVDEDMGAARKLAAAEGITFTTLLDPGGDRMASWGTVMYPETWILSRDGTVLERVIGAIDWTAPEVRARLESYARR